MRLRIRSVLASSRIFKVLLLGAVTVAMILPGGGVAFSQTGAGTVAPAPLFTAIDLNPSGFSSSEALGISGGQQVGWGVPIGADVREGRFHALLWRGRADSVVDLHPKGFIGSQAYGTNGQEQAGRGLTVGGSLPWGPFHALLWRGNADNVVDLHPSGYASSSQALDISGDQQVGSGTIAVPGSREHALLWRGTAASMVDIHPSGFADSWIYGISGGQYVGGGRRDGDCIGPPPTYTLVWSVGAGSAVDLNGPHVVAANGTEQVGYDGGHAMLWDDRVRSVVDLNAFLPPGFRGATATGIDSNGDIVGYAVSGDSLHAFLWKRNVNVKPTAVLPSKGMAPQDLTAPKRLFISSADPVAYILTDPQGRRAGHDPVHNMTYDEIPGAVYRIDSCERSRWTVLEMSNRIAGRYTLDVFGGGNFTVYVLAWGASGHWLTYAFEGTAAPGASSRFTFPGEVITFAGFKASLTINSASDVFEVNGTYTLGPGGKVSPATQDVTFEVAGHFLATIPAGSFRQIGPVFVFKGVINGVAFAATMTPTGVNSGAFRVEGAEAANIEGAKDAIPWIGGAGATQPDYPIKVGLAFGNNNGSVSVNAEFTR